MYLVSLSGLDLANMGEDFNERVGPVVWVMCHAIEFDSAPSGVHSARRKDATKLLGDSVKHFQLNSALNI